MGFARRLAACSVLAAVCWPLSNALAAPLDEARGLLGKGQAVKAKELLQANLANNADNAEYNYLLGIASLDAGKPGDAVFAFERALAIEPGHLLARAELAKALIALTEYEAARRELLQVKGANPPEDVTVKINQLLAQIDQALSNKQAPQSRGLWNAYVEGEIGYDSNINTGPNATTIFIPVLGLPGTLSGFATKQDSSVIGVNAGISGAMPVSEKVDIFGSLDGRFRAHPDQKDFATASVSAVVGARITQDHDVFNLGLTQFTQYIDKYHNDDQTGLFASWQRQVSNTDIVGAFGQYLDIRHPIVKLLDTRLYLGGVTWSHFFGGPGSPLLNMSAYYGHEHEKHENPSIRRDLFGIKANGEYQLRDDMKLFGGLSYQYSPYEGKNIWFARKRVDHRYDLNAGLAYKLDRSWTITPQLIYTFNDSNIKFNHFDRYQALVTVRYNFK